LTYTSTCVNNAIAELDESGTDTESVVGFYSRANIKKENRYRGGRCPDCWSKEHIYPAGRWGREDRKCPHGDLHNLVAADKTVNSDRNNYDFDEVINAIDNKKKTDEDKVVCENCKEGDETWEPAGNAEKGQIARMLFYMDVRYSDPNGTDGTQNTDLNLVRGRSNKSLKGNSSELGNLTTLLKWHCENEVTQYEKDRNDLVQQYQGNRNPFIDVPAFVETIFGPCDTTLIILIQLLW